MTQDQMVDRLVAQGWRDANNGDTIYLSKRNRQIKGQTLTKQMVLAEGRIG